MGLQRLTEPDDLPVSLDEAKAHLHADGTDTSRDAKILVSLRAAIAHVEHRTSRILARALYAYYVDEWPCPRVLEIPASPVKEVSEITYFDEDDAEQTFDDADYVVEITPDAAFITFASDASRPALTIERLRRVTVALLAGYDLPGTSGSDDEPMYKLPFELKAAVLMQTEVLFEAGAIDSDKLANLTKAVEALCDLKKVYRR